MKTVILLFTFAAFSPIAYSADINRRIIAEFDPVAPASASYEERLYGTTTSKWGGLVDFNAGGVFSTGPELWIGTFVVKGDGDEVSSVRREDFWPGERHKLDATRLRWNFNRWQRPMSMRGWYIKFAYSYTRINSRANRFTEEASDNDAIPVGVPFVPSDAPGDETDLVTDIRHGLAFGFGNRWSFGSDKVTLTLGTSFTANFKRSVSVDSKDKQARADYDQIIENLPETRMSMRPLPEANLTFGYAF